MDARDGEDMVERYERDGFAVVPLPLPAALIARAASALQRIRDRNPGLELQTVMNVHLEQSVFGGRVLHGDPDLVEIAADPSILDPVGRLLGGDIVLWGVALFCKPPGGRGVPLHQDGAYWPIRPLAGCTAWVALDDSGPDNGGMRFAPGSHAAGDLAHRQAEQGRSFAMSVESESADVDAVFDVTLPRGHMSLHHVNVVHGSHPNTSSRRRAGLAFRFMPATSYLERAAGVPVFVLRGKERTGRNDPYVTHPRAHLEPDQAREAHGAPS